VREEPEYVSMKPERAKMPGSIEGYVVSFQLRRVNLAGMLVPTNKPKTEAFRASEGLNASRFHEEFNLERGYMR
jgi:hypothetical protein